MKIHVCYDKRREEILAAFTDVNDAWEFWGWKPEGPNDDYDWYRCQVCEVELDPED